MVIRDAVEPPVVIFTDVDSHLRGMRVSGTAAPNVGHLLAAANVALVLCSAYTRAELEMIRNKCGVGDPFICENGAAAFLPEFCCRIAIPHARDVAGYQTVEFGRPYDQVVDMLHRTAEHLRIPVVGFSDMSIEQVACECHLSMLDARLAKLREYSELFRVVGDSLGARDRLHRALQWARLSCATQGQYDYVASTLDPGRAVRLLTRLYRRTLGHVITVAFAGNVDDSVLRHVDMPFVIDFDASPQFRRHGSGTRVTAFESISEWFDRILAIVHEARQRFAAQRRGHVGA
jgi:predicted mannosyl-3-phosphoglycerate phosphatase (HAD superfamily)